MEQARRLGNRLLRIKVQNQVDTIKYSHEFENDNQEDILKKIIMNYYDEKQFSVVENAIDNAVEICTKRKRLDQKDFQDIKKIIKLLVEKGGQ